MIINKSFTITILAIMFIVVIILGINRLIYTYAPPEDLVMRVEQERKAQIISVDAEGNKLWRVYDKGRYIYYMPKGETSWESGGKSSNTMGVK